MSNIIKFKTPNSTEREEIKNEAIENIKNSEDNDIFMNIFLDENGDITISHCNIDIAEMNLLLDKAKKALLDSI